ncbi:MAG: dihydropteroate synthase, partial [Gemmatimonadota bacterium]
VHSLRAEGFEVSIDTFDPDEIRTAVDAGARWVLSVNSTNLEVAQNLDATVVAIPDPGAGLETLEPTLESLEAWGTRYIIDPVIEPIGFGFAESLCRYAEVRRRYPATEMLMGIGNITELTMADTTGVNAVLIGYCQELGIRYVLTTEVIPWARGAVRELDVARRLMHYSVNERQLPKHLDDRLLTVKDPEVLAYSEEELRALQAQITDPNFRIFSDRESIYVFNAERFVQGRNIQEIFRQLDVDEPTHAFYLGKELMKAKIAVDLGKTYRQDGVLSWGYLTPPEEPTEEHVTLTQRSSESREA